MRHFISALVICLLAPAAISYAQQNPITANNRFMYEGAQKILLRSAELMPEEKYAFKPAEGVRTFGQIIGHAADAQYRFCSIVLGEKNPGLKIEKTKTTKAELVAALKESFAYCNKAYDGLTDVSAAEMVKVFGSDMPKIGALTVNQVHSVEHYGNLVVYLRMNGLTPPTSDPEFMKMMTAK
jgi:uncharacterized damage-inducible protein DinB